MAKFLDQNGLLYFWTKIKDKFVAKATGKDLSTNDYTTVEKNKLAGLNNYTLPTASVEILGGVKVGNGLSITNGVLSASGGGVADSVAWTNVAGKPSTFPPSTHNHTASEITDLTTTIASAITSAGHLKREVVTELPAVASADANTIYMIPIAGASGDNKYTEWMVVSGGWEKTGDGTVDLTGYWAKADLVAISNAEIDAIVAA